MSTSCPTHIEGRRALARPAGELLRAIAQRVEVSDIELKEAMLAARPDQMHPTISVRYARHSRLASVRPGTILWDVALLLHIEPEDLRDAIADICDIQPGKAVTLSAWRTGVRTRPPRRERPPPNHDYHIRGVNRTPPRLRTMRRSTGHVYQRWVLWCGWCRQDHSYSVNIPRETVADMHADRMENLCKEKALDREASDVI